MEEEKVFDINSVMRIRGILNLSELSYLANVPYKPLKRMYENKIKIKDVSTPYINRLCTFFQCEPDRLYTNETAEVVEEKKKFFIETNVWKPEGVVYFLKALEGEKAGLTKIGYSIDLLARKNALQSIHNAKLELLHHIASNDAPTLERVLHRIFRNKRIKKTEWFDLSEEDIELIKP